MARAKGKIQSTNLLGWCLTGQHAECRAVVHLSMQNKDYRCGCKCHDGEDKK